MTLHVALIGRNGFVVASDRLRTWGTIGNPNNPQRSHAKKIYCKEPLICAFAGYNPHTHFIDELSKTVGTNPVLTESHLKEFSEGFFRRNPVAGIQPEEILLGSANDLKQLWQIKVYKGNCIFINAFEDKATNQAPVNAHFIPTLFFKRSSPVKQLVFLAALTIWYGEQENNGAIRGLQIVVCKRGVFRELDEAEIDSLTNRCVKFHKSVGDLMFGAG